MEVIAGDVAFVIPPVWVCSRRQYRKRSISQQLTTIEKLQTTVSCARGLTRHALSGVRRRIIDRCKHNDPSLINLKWEDPINDFPRKAIIVSCHLCAGLEMSLLANALAVNHHVRTLDITLVQLTPRSVRAIADLFQTNRTIVHAVLDQTGLGDDGFSQISAALSQNRSLRVLSLRKVGATWNAMIPLGACLAENRTLASLDIRDNYIYHKGIRALSQGLLLNSYSALTSLDVQSTAVNAKGVDALVEVLIRCPSYPIAHINLCNNFVGPNGATSITKALRLNNTLLTLNLSGNACGEEGAVQISEALRVNSSLQQLNLSLNDIRDRGATAIGKALRFNTSLQHIDVNMNKIASIGIRSLSYSLVVNGRMVSMDIASNVTDSIVQDCFTYEICRRLKRNRSRVTMALQLGILMGISDTPFWCRLKDHAMQLPSHSCTSCFDCRGSSGQESDCAMIIGRICSYMPNRGLPEHSR